MSRRKIGCSLYISIVKPLILKYGRLGFQGASRPSPFSTSSNSQSLIKKKLILTIRKSSQGSCEVPQNLCISFDGFWIPTEKQTGRQAKYID